MNMQCMCLAWYIGHSAQFCSVHFKVSLRDLGGVVLTEAWYGSCMTEICTGIKVTLMLFVRCWQ